jgi:hypothetical protein
MANSFFSIFSSDVFVSTLSILWTTLPIWFPILMVTLFLSTWVNYTRAKWIVEKGNTLLELKLPKELMKSPAAMEIIINSMHQPSVGSYIDALYKGRIRPWFSLELVSIGGQVKFFIWTHKNFKNLVESQIYGQFPTVEVYEVPDYSLLTPFNLEKTGLWGMQLALNKADVYPIKTYIDYGLHDDPKEEFKIDPITAMLEYLGSVKPGDQVWIQILIQPHRKEHLRDARIFQKPDWKAGVGKEIEVIMKESPVKIEEGKAVSLMNLTDIQKDTINAIQRNMAKSAFDTMIRALYIAPKDAFNPAYIAGLTSSFKQYGSGNLNGFKPKFTTSFDYPWEDFRSTRVNASKRKIMDAYKRRSYFHPPYKNFKGKPFILTTEELATLFHFPGGVATTPTFTRIVSKKVEPPANLPI